MAFWLVKSMQMHSAAGGGVPPAILSNPISLARPASLLIRADPINPLLPVMIITFSFIGPSPLQAVGLGGFTSQAMRAGRPILPCRDIVRTFSLLKEYFATTKVR